MGCTETKTVVKQILSDYLQRKGYRETPERYAILQEIYSTDSHFDVETLYIHMKNNGYQVSRATIYNNIDLLCECGLVVRHQFGKKNSLYEKAYECKQHDHLICTRCGKVTEFCDPRIQEIINSAKRNSNFTISHHSLYIYGICAECRNEIEKVPITL